MAANTPQQSLHKQFRHRHVLHSAAVTAPFGTLTVIANDAGVVAIRWDTETDARQPDARNPVDRELANYEIVDVAAANLGDHQVLAQAVSELDEYFRGARTVFEVPLAPIGTEFQRQVWNVLRAIPYATTMTYGDQARALGDANKARAVGAANGRNPIPIIVPCHRVVGTNGKLTGFAGGLTVKAWLIDHERAVSAGA